MGRTVVNSFSASVRERGSIFFYILLGVVLFGALAFTISRGLRSQSTDAMSARELELAASELIERAQAMSRAIDRIRANNISESDLCFSHDQNSKENENSYKAVEACSKNASRFYHADGGGMNFMHVPPDWLDVSGGQDEAGGEWLFSFTNAVIGFGEGDMNADTSVELIAFINHLKEPLCRAVNQSLGVEGIPDNGGDFDRDQPYNRAFTARGKINVRALEGKNAGCFRDSGGGLIFYSVLIERD